MDHQELNDWREFCVGTRAFPSMYFSRVFMEMFAKPLSKRDRDDLGAVFSDLPNSSKTLGNLLRIGTPENMKSDQEIAAIAVQDLSEMKRIIQDPLILATLDLGLRKFTTDKSWFWQAHISPLNGGFIEAICDHIIDFNNDSKITELGYAFYGIANDLHLQYALVAGLIGCDLNCDNYVELYLNGANYALEPDGVLLFRHRE